MKRKFIDWRESHPKLVNIYRKHFRVKRDLLELLLKYRTTNMFININIETINVCNYKCVYCPFSIYEREKKYMDIKLFNKIIDDLVDMNYKGTISLHLFCEPLMDERLPELYKIIRNKLPKTRLLVITNGSLLTKELFLDLIHNGVNGFFISKHTKNKLESIQEVKRFCREYHPDISFEYDDFEEEYIFYDRLGIIPNFNGEPPKNCRSHIDCFSINVDGKAVLCCNDFFAENPIGDLKKQTVSEIWFSKQYEYYKKSIPAGNLDNPVCKNCKCQIGWKNKSD